MNGGDYLNKHIGETKLNNQGSLMEIVEYNGYKNIVVEFQDKYKVRVNTIYANFKSGSIKNPYYPSIYGVGVTGNKYPISKNCDAVKEYDVWHRLLERCVYERLREKYPAYNNVICCDEWLLYENFYEWLHSQENFDKWLNGKRWAIDKDILIKGNKIYKPEACCLVPQNVNCLFLKREAERGKYPIGVRYRDNGFLAVCRNPFLNKAVELGHYSAPERAFQAYKVYKEDIIKQVAEAEYNNKNITKDCYEAMMNYEVEITD